jgi:hypothetical protein
MTLVFPEEQRYDCGSCTKCCRTVWNVHVSPRAWDRIVGSPLFERMKAEHGEDPIYEQEVMGEKTALARVNKGGCIFLAPDRLCSVHRELGVGAKPLGCREFPFLPVPTPDGVFVGVSFYCSAVQANHGRPLGEHGADIEGMLGEYRYERVGFDPIPLDPRHSLDWPSYKSLEVFARARIEADLESGPWHVASAVAAIVRAIADGPDGIVPEAVWKELLDGQAPAARDDVLEQVERMFLTGVVGVLESASPEECRANTEAVFRRGVLRCASFGGEVDLAHFDDFRTRFDPAWSRPELLRYFRQLLFRKFLALKRPIVENAAAFYLALPLLEWYRDLSAYAAGKLQPDIGDVRNAFDVIERGLVMHARNMDPFFRQLAETLVKLV